jgi:mRNA interferase MazF
MRDLHPLMVLSTRVFNERTGIVIGLPMTTATYNETNPFAVRIKPSKSKVSYILTHQPKSFDWRARHAKPHPAKLVSREAFEEASASLRQILGFDLPA